MDIDRCKTQHAPSDTDESFELEDSYTTDVAVDGSDGFVVVQP